MQNGKSSQEKIYSCLPKLGEGKYADSGGDDGQRAELYPRQFCRAGSCGPSYGAEVCDRFSFVPAGTGTQTPGHPSQPTDHVQLVAVDGGASADPGL